MPSEAELYAFVKRNNQQEDVVHKDIALENILKRLTDFTGSPEWDVFVALLMDMKDDAQVVLDAAQEKLFREDNFSGDGLIRAKAAYLVVKSRIDTFNLVVEEVSRLTNSQKIDNP